MSTYAIVLELKKDIINWRPSSLSELTPIIFKRALPHFGWDASN